LNGYLVALALTAGAVAALNPCGAALFPSYLAILFEDDGPGTAPLARGLEAGGLMTLGFITIFLLAGVLVASLGRLLLHVAPFISVVIALLVLAIGVMALSGHLAMPSFFEGLLLRHRPSGGSRLGRVYTYGLAYAFASLSCALPVFLAIAAQALSLGAIQAVVTFLVYAVGMGAVITAASILTFYAREWVRQRIVGAQPFITRAMGVILVASGAYLLWYWLLGPEHLIAVTILL